MAVTKRYLKIRPGCKVKFTVSPDDAIGAESISLVGDFNEWSADATPMKRMKNGSFSAEVEIAPGTSYRYRYLTNDGRWINETEADGYEFCEFAQADNSILML